MERDIDGALDKCLTQLQRGQSTLDECLALYPELAAELRPLLETALAVHRVPLPVSSPAAFAAGKQRLLQALAEKNRHQEKSLDPLARVASWILAPFNKKQTFTTRKRASASRVALAATTLLILLIAGSLLLRSWLGETIARTATLADASGVVQILPAGSDTWQPAQIGSVITDGDRIHTGASSTATLTFFDGSTTRLEARTNLRVSHLSSQRSGRGRIIVLHQRTGQTHHRVEELPGTASRFEIETPTAVATVRGTAFTVAVSPDGTTDVLVIEGHVAVTAQETTVVLHAGQRTTIRPERPPVPVPPIATTPAPSAPHTATCTPTPTATPVPTSALRAPVTTEIPQPFDQTGAPQPPGQTLTPQPPGQVRTPSPPGQTITPLPPGQMITVQPPGLTNTPQPPGQTKTPQPPGQTKTPQPPGQTKTPQPPGQTKTPKPTKVP